MKFKMELNNNNIEENNMKKIKIIFTRGIQASSKTTWAKQFIKDNKDYKRICRDDCRHMLSAYTFNNENEKLVTLVEEYTINMLIEKGYNIIIDSMNLNKEKLEKRINKYKLNWECKYEITPEIKNFPIELNEAIMRDKLRDFSIGEKVIKRTWHKYRNELIEMLEEGKPKIEYNFNLPDAVCFDVDGTLFNRKNRNPFDFTKVKKDEPIKIVFEQMKFHHKIKGRYIFVFSGRDDSCWIDTFECIKKNFENNDFELRMRKAGDNRRDSIVKREMYEQYIKGKYNLIAVYDDRPQVLNECWRDLGIYF